MIKIRRIYEPEEPGEQYKIFVDKLWPRGISKEKAVWDEWRKEIAPGNELRKWFNHDPDKWDEFKRLYRLELSKKENKLTTLKQLEQKYGTLTLLYAAKDKDHNNAVVLREVLL